MIDKNILENDVGNFYGKQHKVFDYHGKALSSDRISKILKECKIPANRLKDIVFMEAGGSGNKARSFVQAGCKHIYYIDLSGENTSKIEKEIADKGYPISVIHGSLLDNHPQLVNTCDMIMSTGVIHHTICPAQALANMSKWLKQEGVLYINCYSSGTLLYFWVYLIRELLSLIKTDYDELFNYMNRPRSNIRMVDIMDHALTPVMHPTNADIIQHDLERLGFEIIKGEKNIPIDHTRTDGMLKFIAKKIRNVTVKQEDLKYQAGIDQLSLSYDYSVKRIIDKFFRFKAKLANSNNCKSEVFSATFFLTKIFNEIQDVNSFRSRLRTLRRTKNIRILFAHRPPQYFYRYLELLCDSKIDLD